MSTPIGRTGLSRISAFGGEMAAFQLGRPGWATFFDHFLGDSIDARLSGVVEGTDGATADIAVLTGAAGAGGKIRMTTGDAGTGYAADGVQLNQALQYSAARGGIDFETKLSLGRLTDAYLFVGFTDTLALEAPITSASSADTLTSNASDAVGIMFDTRMASDVFHLVGVKADVDAVRQNSNIAPVVNTDVTLRVVGNADGDASFYINGVQVGVIEDAFTPSVALTPVIALSNLSGTVSLTADVDVFAAAAKL